MTIEELEKLVDQRATTIAVKQIQEKGYISPEEFEQKLTEALGLKSAELLKVMQTKVDELAKLGKPDEKKIGEEEKLLALLEPKGGFYSISEFAYHVFKAGPDGRGLSEKLATWDKKVGEARNYVRQQKTAGSPTLEIGDPEEGGYLIPTEFAKFLLETGIEKSNFVDRCMQLPMQTTSLAIPALQNYDHSTGYVYGAVMLYWLDEKAGKTAAKPKFDKVNLRLNKLIGMCYATDEILADSPITLEPLLRDKFTDAFAWTMDWVLLNGSGAGQPLGIVGAPCKVTQAKEAGQAAATIMYENIVKMYSRLYPPSLANAIWVANSDTFPQLAFMTIPVGTGGAPVYLPANAASGKPFDTLMGKPLVFSEHCRTLGTEGDIYLVDWKQYLVGQKAGAGGGMQYASSIHLKFDYDQTAFRFVYRVDGQPWWKTFFTPRYSAVTQSPIVTLAVRA